MLNNLLKLNTVYLIEYISYNGIKYEGRDAIMLSKTRLEEYITFVFYIEELERCFWMCSKFKMFL